VQFFAQQQQVFFTECLLTAKYSAEFESAEKPPSRVNTFSFFKMLK